MKVSIITAYFEPEIASCTHLLSDLCRDFVSYGAEVTVITGIPSRGIDEKTRIEYMDRLNENIVPNLTVKRVGFKSGEKANFVFRGLRYLYQTYILYRNAKRIETDIYLIVSTPPFLGIAGAVLSKRVPTVYNLQDIFPDSLINVEKGTQGSLFIGLLHRMEQIIYKKNTHLLTISEEMEKTLLLRSVPEDKITVVYNWTDISKIHPVNRKDNILFERFSLPLDRFYISYAGNIGLAQNLGTVIDGAEILSDSHSGIHFVIIGDGSWKREMLDQIQKKKLKNISVFPLQPVEEVEHVYSLGDVEIVSIGKNVSKSALPSKTWNIMAAGRPILCEVDTGSELNLIIEENQCGICIEPGDSIGFAQAVIQLYENKEQVQYMGTNGRCFVEQHLTRQTATKEYFDCLQKVVAKNKGE